MLTQVNEPLGPGEARVTRLEQGGMGGRLVEGGLPRRWTGHTERTSVLRRPVGSLIRWRHHSPKPLRGQLDNLNVWGGWRQAMGSARSVVSWRTHTPPQSIPTPGLLRTLCQPSKIRLQYSVVTCPLAQSVTSDSSPTLCKRTCPQHSQLWE